MFAFMGMKANYFTNILRHIFKHTSSSCKTAQLPYNYFDISLTENHIDQQIISYYTVNGDTVLYITIQIPLACMWLKKSYTIKTPATGMMKWE